MSAFDPAHWSPGTRALGAFGAIAAGTAVSVATGGVAAAGGLALAGLFTNFLAGDMAQLWEDRRRDPKYAHPNHDLIKLVGDSIAHVLYEAAKDPQLQPHAKWLRKIARASGQFYASLAAHPDFQEIASDQLVRIFERAAAAQAASYPLISEPIWSRFVESLSDKARTTALPQSVAVAAKRLHEGLFGSIREMFKRDFQGEGRAYAALCLDMNSLLLAAVGQVLAAQQGFRSELRALTETLRLSQERYRSALTPEQSRALEWMVAEFRAVSERTENILAVALDTRRNTQELLAGQASLRQIVLRGQQNELGLTNVLSLAEYRASLLGFRRFLTSDNLPFRAPASGAPWHPAELLQRLETSADGKGVLLAGAGGVGKTRTTFETALLAESQGWRVIYALPGQPAVTAEKLLAAVHAQGAGKTLIVIEYLDQMQELDLGVVRRQLIQAAAQQGIQLGLIGNCRPGYLLKENHDRDAALDTIRLAPSAQEAESLSRYVSVRTAPRAVELLGEAEVLRLCGRRPIIALLVAQQLEQLAEDGGMRAAEFAAVRSGDLAHWLRRRLAEDDLVVRQPESIWETAPPPPHLVAAAAVLACTPDEDAALVAAAAVALQAIGKPDSTASRVTQVLMAVGWLEREGPWLQVVHDVVADELADQSIFEIEAIRHRELRALLCPAIRSARSLGRLAKTLTRVEGAVSPTRCAQLRLEAQRWLKETAPALGETLAADNADNGSYALGAVLGGSLLEESAIEAWPALVTPWLARHQTTYEARHLLFRGLRAHHEKILGELIPIAMAWLGRWHKRPSASFVLAPLLRLTPADEVFTAPIFSWALAWLDRFPDKPEAAFVLPPLLARADLPREAAEDAVVIAQAWLDRYTDSLEAKSVFNCVLKRAELEGEGAAGTIELALDWLTRFHDHADSGIVLAPLLGRADLNSETVTRLTTLALQWLSRFASDSSAQFVLNEFLGREDLTGPAASRGTELALLWLKQFSDQPEAQFVLSTLLTRANLQGEEAAEAMTRALGWLKHFSHRQEAQFVFYALLSRSDLHGAQAAQAITLAFAWLEQFSERQEAQFVLTALVGRADLDAQTAAQATQRALEWLAIFPASPGTDFVLKTVLERGDLEGEAAAQAMAIALQWLAMFPAAQGTDFVLKKILERDDLVGEAASQAMAVAFDWLTRCSRRREAGFVLAPLLGRTDLKGAEAARALSLAAEWLATFPTSAGTDFVLKKALERSDLKGQLATQAIALAVQWLASFPAHEGTDFVLKKTLERADLKGRLAKQAMALALRWVMKSCDRKEAGFVLAPLLSRGDLNGNAATLTILLALRWLARYCQTPEAGYVLSPLLARWDLNGAAAPQAIARARQWLEVYGTEEKAGYVLVACCLSTDRANLPAQVQQCARDWSAAHRKCGGGAPALILQLSALGEEAPERRKYVMSALGWIRRNDRHPSFEPMLSALLQRHADLREVREVAMTAVLDAAWRYDPRKLKRPLTLAQGLVPDGDASREEIELLLDGQS